MAWKVIVVDPCLSWLRDLRQADRAILIRISQAITALAEAGPGLRRPLVNTVSGSGLPNLRELRPGSAGGTEVRLLVVLDPFRRTVFMVGGGKSGKWPDWRTTAIPLAEEAYADYLRNEGKEERGEAMRQPPRGGPGSRPWDDLAAEFGFLPGEKREIRAGAGRMIAEVRARRIADVRKRQNASQAEVAAAMGVSSARVSRIEKGQLERGEVETLAAYVAALGGTLRIIADFGDETYVLG